MTTAVTRSRDSNIAVLDGPEWHSSDDDDDPGVETKVVRKKSKVIKAKKNAPSKTNKYEEGSDVIYLGHLPSNFEEEELRGFLSQFGNVTHVKLIRARKTANPRGYCFVKFDDAEVAQVVADTMSGYLMGEKRLVCHILPKDKVHPDLFKGADREFKKVDWAGLHRIKVNRPKSSQKMKEITQRLMSRERKRREKMKAAGIDYEFPGYTTSNEAFPVSSDNSKRKQRMESATKEKFEPPPKKSKIGKSKTPSTNLGAEAMTTSENIKADDALPLSTKGEVNQKAREMEAATLSKKKKADTALPFSKKRKVEQKETNLNVKNDGKLATPGKKHRESATVTKVSVERMVARENSADTDRGTLSEKKSQSRTGFPMNEEKASTVAAQSKKTGTVKQKGRMSLDAAPTKAVKENKKKSNAKGRKSL